MSMPRIVPYSQKTTIIGYTGTGKTVLLKHIIRGMLEKKVRMFIYDTEHEHEYPSYPFLTIYRPKYPPQTKESIDEFIEVCGKLAPLRNIELVIENINFFTNPKTYLPLHFADILYRGRKRGIGLIITTQRLAEAHASTRANCNHWFVFQTYLSNDKKYLEENIGKENVKKLEELSKYYFLYVDWYKKGKLKDKVSVCSPVSDE